MKPTWDALAEEYKDSAAYLIGDVDCTAEGKSLCTEMGVRGYPTIKWGDPGDLQDYKGGRDEAALKKHMTDKMVPVCSPGNLDNCSDDQKASLTTYQAMSASDLTDLTKTTEVELAAASDEHEKTIFKLEIAFATMKKSKSGSISLMKAVTISSSKDASTKDEL
mmetsp:Transcript_13309/g.22026  ORF Transcript_13309/g.22026 Transcript_13309/m.22026 type:complete len:164 (+) Transcript_13309:228-719(+)|eukprot:CAMPEP_0119016284 /NCGR_PEP_ID=MMETSP1176-20130426/11913_1 /TAXON_ID=265551 /ORGANISM="Synedropsis recta cf, Strain CCMP1620" /LENGTH=163 /DNA_ID=CAMNT_0006969627 /DNA_START=208 /DNA_END=699 /DNA_ORIENTATION=-